MKKFIEEFKAFALKGNMMDMAVGIIIGSSFSGIVTSLTDNIINPLLNFATSGKIYTLNDIISFATAFLSSLVNFFIMAFVLFCLVKTMNKLKSIGQKKERDFPTTKKCPHCYKEIHIHASRCPYCTSLLDQDNSNTSV